MFQMRLFYSVLIFFLLFSCKKDTDNNTPISSNLTFKQSDYHSYEVAALISSSTLSAPTYNATIDGSIEVTLERNDSFLIFIMPELTTGAHCLKINIGTGDQTLNFNIVQGNVITDPDLYFQNYISTIADENQNNSLCADTLLGAADLNNFYSDQQILQDSLNAYIQFYSTLTSDEKLQLVKVLEANKRWMDELLITLNELEISLSQLRPFGVEDYELKVTAALANF